MSYIPKTMLLPSTESIEFIRDLPEEFFRDELLNFLNSLLIMLQADHKSKRDFAEAGGMKTKTWRVTENSDGDLIFEKWDGTQWQLGQKIKGS